MPAKTPIHPRNVQRELAPPPGLIYAWYLSGWRLLTTQHHFRNHDGCRHRPRTPDRSGQTHHHHSHQQCGEFPDIAQAHCRTSSSKYKQPRLDQRPSVDWVEIDMRFSLTKLAAFYIVRVEWRKLCKWHWQIYKLLHLPPTFLPLIVSAWPSPQKLPRASRRTAARADYFIEQKFEAGVMLMGWEVKSIRDGKVQLAEAYVQLHKGEAFLAGCNITPLLSASTHVVAEPQVRKLLLHARGWLSCSVPANKKAIPSYRWRCVEG